jgi:hypothetical protein
MRILQNKVRLPGRFVFVLFSTVIGIKLLTASYAAITYVAVEPENGTLTGNATVGNDAAASGGKYVKFQAAGNLTTNPSFETNTSGWYDWQSTLSRVANSSAPNGSYVGQVAYSSGTTGSYTIETSPAPVASTVTGTTYTAKAYVAAANSQSVGRSIVIDLRESNPSGTSVRVTYSSAATLTTGFQAITVSTTPVYAGDIFSVAVEQGGPQTGDSFYVDAISLVASAPATPGCTYNGAVAPCIGGATNGASGWGTPVLDSEFTGSTPPAPWDVGWFMAGSPYGSTVTSTSTNVMGDCDSANNVTMPGDGTLHLAVTNTPSSCVTNGNEPATGAVIQTDPKDGRPSGGFQYAYGFAEIRAYLPGSGSTIDNWPAIWGNGQNWPVDGEDDIMEGFGSPYYHFHYLGCTDQCEGGIVLGNFTGWHTFASDWEPGSITYYYDGVKVGQETSGITSAPMYLTLSNDIQSGATAVPSAVQIQYVRVWQ